MDQGITLEEAKESLEEDIELFENGLEGLYNLEREMEMGERVRDECLKYMTLEDYTA